MVFYPQGPTSKYQQARKQGLVPKPGRQQLEEEEEEEDFQMVEVEVRATFEFLLSRALYSRVV